ncbi:MAG: phage major capsid protein [Methylococcaceae bacterium]
MPLYQLREDFQAAGGENCIKRNFPLVAARLLKDHEHPADVQRSIKLANEEATKLLDRGTAEKRQLNPSEQNAFDAIMALTAIRSYVVNQEAAANKAFNNDGRPSEQDRRIYAKGEKCAFNHRPEALEGLSLGNIMRGLAIGSNGNHNLQNALSEGTDSAGGYTAPVEILREFIDKMRSKSVLLNSGARTVILDAKKSNIATISSDPVAGWRAENAAVSESDMVLGNVQFTPKSLAVLVKVSRELLEDSLNIEEILLNALAQGIATQLDYAGLYGSGASNEPLGLKSILTTASLATTLATNGAKLSASGYYREIVKGMAAVAASNDQATAMIVSPRTKYDLGWMSDTTNQPLRAPAIVSDNLQIMDTSSVPNNITVGTATAICSEAFIGNFENMLLGLRQGLRIEMLPQTYAGNLQVGYIAHLRADWAVARTNSFWMLKGILAE